MTTTNKVPNKAKTHIYWPGLQKGWELARANKKPEHQYLCLYCGKTFFRRGNKINRVKYCSLQCKYLAAKGKSLPRLLPKLGKTFICKNCGMPFYRHPSEIKRGRVNYCSLQCRKESNYNPYQKGALCPRWKGGVMLLQGYRYVKAYDHPNRNSNDYIAEHRLIMETHLGRFLTANEEVHHRNGIKTDNSFTNLELVIKKVHNGHVACPYCQKEFAIK